MFEAYNTDSIKILDIVSAIVTETDIGHREHSYGETRFYQLGIKIKGETKICYNKKNLSYTDNSVLFLPCEKTHTVPYNKIYQKPGYGICIFFSSAYPLYDEAKIYYLQDNRLAQLFNDILRAFRSSNGLEVKSLFYKILMQLDLSESEKDRGSFSDVISYIDNNIRSSYIDISELAAIYGCSADYFRHKFRSTFGISPKKYILMQKLNIAKDLLLNSSLNIESIASQVGFLDNNYFTRFFKKEIGCSPSQFRKNLKKFM